MGHFWRDGGTRKVYIAGIPGLYDELNLVVRTTTNEQIEAADDEMRGMVGANEAALRKRQAQFIAEQITSWDASDGGEVAPINARNIRELQPALSRRVKDIVYGMDGGDVKSDEVSEPGDTATLQEREGNSAAA